jgi:hypothetical protein
VAVGQDAVLTDHLDGGVEGHGVDVGAEHYRPRAVGAGDAGEDIARVGAGLWTGVVLLDVEAEPAQLGRDGVGHGPLAAGRALDLAEADELRDEALALLVGGRMDRCRRHGGAGYIPEKRYIDRDLIDPKASPRATAKREPV